MFDYQNPETRRTALRKEVRERIIASSAAKDEYTRLFTNSTAHRNALGLSFAEALVRDIINVRGNATERDMSAARAPSKSDGSSSALGRFEVKGGGNLGTPAHHIGWFDESDVYPTAKHVLWILIDRVHDTDDLVDNTVVLTRDEFMDLLNSVSRKGLQSTLHLSRNGSNGSTELCMQVMAFQPTPLRKLREKIGDAIDQGEAYTLRAWLQDHERNGW